MFHENVYQVLHSYKHHILYHHLYNFSSNQDDHTLVVKNNNRIGIGTSFPGERLEVRGNTIMKGEDNSAATSLLLLKSSNNTSLMRVFNNGTIAINTTTPSQSSTYCTKCNYITFF